MKRALILVEGQTEEAFVDRVLAPHFRRRDLYLKPTRVVTKRVKQGKDFRGGIARYGKVRRDLRSLLGDTGASVITTMIDYYGLPKDFPGMDSLPQPARPRERVRHLEEALERKMNDRRFHAYFSLHEFEALLLADPVAILGQLHGAQNSGRLLNLSSPPEEINDGATTHPSARIEEVAKTYRKLGDGIPIAEEIGLQKIREKCPHFAEWIERLESIAN